MTQQNSFRQILFDKDICDGSVLYQGKGDVIVNGNMKNGNYTGIIYFWAAAPPTNGISFSGSGMPYPSPLVAYDRTPNKGAVQVVNGKFRFSIKYPNAYYIGLGSLYIPPHINMKFCSDGNPDMYFSIQIDDGIPFRMLTYPAPPTKKPRNSPMFYCEPEKGARSQEQILRVSSYPTDNKMPDNFWGDRPSMHS
jgi:hypothetical protein